MVQYPQACIDLETGNKENAIRNVKIYNNKLYSAESKRAIVLSKNVYETSIWANEIEGQIRTYNAENEINIYNNTINNGGIIGVLSESNIEDEKYYVKKIQITNNVLKNAYISLGRLNDSIIEKNEIENGYISVENMNSAVFNNKIINSQDRHEENWGVIRKNGGYKLSPLYDNGCNLLKEFYDYNYAQKYYEGKKDFEAYIERSVAVIRNNKGKKYKHFELVKEMYKRYPNQMKKEIINLKKLTNNEISKIVNKIPNELMQEKQKEFIIKYVEIRKNRLLNIVEEESEG